jgi:hypothetical protein
MLGMPFNTTSKDGMRQIRRPPDNPKMKGRPDDSVVYRPGGHNYSEFIVYDKAQTYPEFLIEYIRE